MRILALFLLLATLLHMDSASAANPSKDAVLYKNPGCVCCDDYATYLRERGIRVTVEATEGLALIKRRHGVPEDLEGCHTVLLDGYVIEGHVPMKALDRLFAERPKITGIALPGMPEGSPGMGGDKSGPFEVYAFSKGGSKIYAIE